MTEKLIKKAWALIFNLKFNLNLTINWPALHQSQQSNSVSHIIKPKKLNSYSFTFYVSLEMYTFCLTLITKSFLSDLPENKHTQK